MRSLNAEHLDSLPVLDVSALKHIAYVFDALIYYMRSGVDSPVTPEVIREPLEPWNDQVSCLILLLMSTVRYFNPSFNSQTSIR